ncbi:MAG: 2-hydroxychromene-2-carboxylate isomerase [Deltaproteobacteria bacterium]|jgi:2-hydroxychromene-2-carboxylate isomerase|nr:2-hydroxychromene-2-carboxylate isomerase [Deltaproteobacteria bacterium]
MTEPDRTARLASRSDPSPFQRRATSVVMSFLFSQRRQDLSRRFLELRRRLTGSPHRVEYFHQADDPYSHAACQLLEPLAAAYDIELAIHLTGPNTGANNPEPELLAAFARRDVAAMAPHRGLRFDDPGSQPAPEAVEGAQGLLVGALEKREFAALAPRIGEALWSGDKDALEALAATHAPADPAAMRAAVEQGTKRRRRLGHYSGGMFYYAGEWYWGVDRIDHLEKRLASLGATRDGAETPIAPRPEIDPGPVRDDGSISLEFFPSLRSPYTAASFDPTLTLARQSGVRLVLRPVLPMVMRGVPATFDKGRYIFTDAGREAALLGTPYGPFLDPIGAPVKRGYSLYPWAASQGKGAELLSSFLRAAFSQGVDTGSDEGMKQVVEQAGLSWSEARAHLDTTDWEEELEANRLAMVNELGLWGVPSYRVSGPTGEPDYAVWGQDRLWLVAHEIRRRIALRRT